MPKSVFKKLGIGEAKPTTVMLQLADRSYVQPEGKIEDLLVRVDKFIFPADFLILDYEAYEHAPIILGLQDTTVEECKVLSTTTERSTRLKPYLGAHTGRDKGVVTLRDA
ncbi:hypothetical protein V6N12_018557 [Hibiscus sabdariffa]|uniref:Uncharacterized protein n=1 Tax=Hibiscus sabdariffa TaxID=183260 RepID=A0ABR2BY80_9ROSI